MNERGPRSFAQGVAVGASVPVVLLQVVLSNWAMSLRLMYVDMEAPPLPPISRLATSTPWCVGIAIAGVLGVAWLIAGRPRVAAAIGVLVAVVALAVFTFVAASRPIFELSGNISR